MPADKAMSQRSASEIGCLAIALPLFVVLSPVVLLMTIWEDWRGNRQFRKFRRKHGPRKLGLLVYSNSPNWQSYIEQRWLHEYESQFVVLNWSERATWNKRAPFEAALFRRYAGTTDFNPAAIIFINQGTFATFRAWVRAIRDLDPLGMLAPSSQRVRVIRFWKAFRDYKHGKPHALHRAEAELAEIVASVTTV